MRTKATIEGSSHDAFLWGAATSHHQVEDDEPSDWADWTRDPSHTIDGSRAGRACEWWSGRAEEDLTLAARLGHTAHRLGLSWARLEPEPGRFDEVAFDRYARLLDHAHGEGLTIMATLFHFTLPRWLAKEGACLSPRFPERFARFCDRVARRLGDRIDLVATINEPSVLAFMAYAGKRWPPGLGRIDAFFRALAAILRAHAAGYAALLDARPASKVGLVLNAPRFDPASGSRRDLLAARLQDRFFNAIVLDALTEKRGRVAELAGPLRVSALPKIPGLRGSFHWLGLNYYGRYRVRFDPRAAGTLFGAHVQEHNVRLEHVDWGEIHPDGLRDQLLRFAQASPGTPLYVTENGVMDPTDARRVRYLEQHVAAVEEAMAGGAPVRGYFHWSLLDNFEWAEGWRAPFGLVAVDRETGVRTPRPSAERYRALIEAKEGHT
ncbi:MAG: family 1 glycosylhydrolase [Deltaproteobacteria bacterium]|nr:family 1 glycosylhydrolase [Deltaproteobacteria bacterium]